MEQNFKCRADAVCGSSGGNSGEVATAFGVKYFSIAPTDTRSADQTDGCSCRLLDTLRKKQRTGDDAKSEVRKPISRAEALAKAVAQKKSEIRKRIAHSLTTCAFRVSFGIRTSGFGIRILPPWRGREPSQGTVAKRHPPTTSLTWSSGKRTFQAHVSCRIESCDSGCDGFAKFGRALLLETDCRAGGTIFERGPCPACQAGG